MTPVWRKSSRSGSSGNESSCVEVANLLGSIGVRDSKDPHGPRLALPTERFRELLAGIKCGTHDPA